MKKLSLIFAMFFFLCGVSMAQTTVRGTVSDDSGETLIGANVVEKGTTNGVPTDLDGNYTITVADGNATLVISYAGYETREMPLNGATSLNVTLSEGIELTEVVVTGLGIKKEKKALGYGVTTLGSKDVELKPEADVARVLRGKVPGVNITSTSGLSGSGTNVIIRGYSSITGDNQPLFVVDGVPFNSDTNGDRDFTSGGATASSRFLDLDPNNIEEISILKGLSATVLYGQAGRNGVVLVTTKNGNAGSDLNKKMEIEFSQSLFSVEAASIPDDQDNYGNGWQNAAAFAFSNWGAPFDDPNNNGLVDGQITHPYDGKLAGFEGADYEYKAYDNLQQFFQTGLSSQTSLNVSANVAPGTSMNFSYGLLKDQGFTPDRADGESSNNLTKHNFGMGIGSKLSNGIRLNGSFNYTTSDRNSPPATPIYSSNPFAGGASLFSNVLYVPRSFDLNGMPFADPVTGESVYYRLDVQHPLWTVNNINDNENVNRFFGSLSATYDITDYLNFTYRLGYDRYNQQQRYSANRGGPQLPDGLLVTSQRINFLLDHNFFLTFDKNLSDDINLNVIAGFNPKAEDRDYTIATSTGQFVYGLQSHDNFTNHTNFSFIREENVIGAYAAATVGFKNFVYLNLSGRNDWTSTLEKENRSIFYPSASVSFVPTDAFEGLRGNDWVNYLKLRVGYGTSAGYPDPYQTRNVLNTATNQFVTVGGDILNTNSVSNQIGNLDLKPELHTELELGIEAKLVKNRVGIDFSYYNKDSKDLIIPLSLDPSTGSTSTTVNVAEVNNKGVELGLNVTPLKTDDLYLNLGWNFTRNKNTVVSLRDGTEELLIEGLSFLGNFAIPGEAYGVIKGTQIVRDEATGRPIVGANGLYQQAPEEGVIGDPNPDYLLSTSGTLGFKGLALRVQFDYRKGGDIWASTPSTLYSRGILQESGEFDRFIPVIVPGLIENSEGVLVENNVQNTSNDHFWRDAGVWYDENRIFDGTNLRLREISLSYTLPKSLLANTPFGRADLILSGQNLWYKTFNVPAGANYDTEVLSLGVGNGQGFDFVTGPTSKRWGGTIRVTF